MIVSNVLCVCCNIVSQCVHVFHGNVISDVSICMFFMGMSFQMCQYVCFSWVCHFLHSAKIEIKIYDIYLLCY